MSDGRQLLVIGIILAAFGILVVAGGPALAPGEAPTQPATQDAENGAADDDDANDDQPSVPAVVQECAAEPPEDFSDPDGGNADTIGWVDGYWYDEPLDIDAEDGLTEDELETLSARTAARFEAMRCITADEGVPPVTIQSREEFQADQEGLFADIPADDRLFDNAKLATMLLVDSETDSIEQRQSNRGAAVGGTYNFIENEVTIVSDDPNTLQIDEEILAHELGHAIQDQQFNLSQYERPTTDIDKGMLGLIEGDVHLIEQRYLDACLADEWEQECITEETGTEEGDIDLANWGLYFKSFQPYSDGPAFVEHIYETEDGWDAVDELYANPPTSAIQLVKPEQYPELQPVDVEVPDESTDEWERVGQSNGFEYDTIGIAGISAMFMSPLIETRGMFSIYDREDMINPEGALSPFEYHHPETAGWRGDSLYTYQGEGNESGTVWELQWNDPADWEPFVESYEELIEFRGGEAVSDDERTYEFAGTSGYEMAVTIDTDGDRVTIVTAPSVEQLDEIHTVESATGS